MGAQTFCIWYQLLCISIGHILSWFAFLWSFFFCSSFFHRYFSSFCFSSFSILLWIFFLNLFFLCGMVIISISFDCFLAGVSIHGLADRVYCLYMWGYARRTVEIVLPFALSQSFTLGSVRTHTQTHTYTFIHSKHVTVRVHILFNLFFIWWELKQKITYRIKTICDFDHTFLIVQTKNKFQFVRIHRSIDHASICIQCSAYIFNRVKRTDEQTNRQAYKSEWKRRYIYIFLLFIYSIIIIIEYIRNNT